MKMKNFFQKKITIAKWKFNLFGVFCIFLGIIAGFYLTVSRVIPKIFAADLTASITKDTDTDFSQGTLSSTAISGTGSAAILKLVQNSYQTNVLNTAGLVSYWKMDNDWNDSRGNNGLTNYGAVFGAARYGVGAGTFNGTNFAEVADNPSLDITNQITLEAWVNFNAVGDGSTRIIDKSNASCGAPWSMYDIRMAAATNEFAFDITTGGVNHVLGGNTTNWSANAWHYVVGTYDGSTMKLYVDGNLDGSQALSGAISTNNQPVDIGRNKACNNQYFHGSIDEAAIYSRALSASEVAAHYAGSLYAPSGTWESATDSNVINTGWNNGWGDGVNAGSTAFSANISNVSASDTIKFEMRTATTAAGLASATYINLGTATGGTTFTKTKADLDSLGVAAGANSYIQVRLTLAQTDGTTPQLDSFTINYLQDTTPPTNASNVAMEKTAGGAAIASNGWTNNLAPYFSWTAGSDSGSGIKGYCLYLGTSATGNPGATGGGGSEGLLGTSPVSTVGTGCQFITSSTYIDFANTAYRGSTWLSSSSSPYYLNIKAIDNSNNVTTDPIAQFQFRFDNTAPANIAYFSLPGDFVSSKGATFTWPTSGSNTASDGSSGIAGLQYRIGSSGIWYGTSHNGNQDQTDVLSLSDGAYTFQTSPDFANIQEGTNIIYVRAIDNAGNVSTYIQGALKINTTSPSTPLNLSVSPADAQTNAYSFSWDPPATYAGSPSDISYCYTVNVLPSAVTCNFTNAGVTSLAKDAFATTPGKNTLYVVARESGNINYDTYASVDFTYSGSAPGIPSNADVADISIKASSEWRLAVSWGQPTDLGAGIASYEVYRSVTAGTCSSSMSNFSQIGTTAGISYTDSGLDQKTYYYCIKACDNANNCSAASTTVSAYPTGKYTEPAIMTSSPSVSNTTTKKATISWSTDRNSDSKIAYGLKSGDYYAEELSNSNQVTDHEINLTNLDPGTTYYYVAKWTDGDGNTGTSEEETFKTDPAPEVKEISATEVGLSDATIQFTPKGASKAKIYYGTTTSFGGVKEISTSTSETTYTVQLTGLMDGTKYFYKVDTFDSDGDEYSGDINSFTTLPRPKISNVQLQNVYDVPDSEIEVDWTSNTEISSIVTYHPEDNPADSRDVVDVNLVSGPHKLIIKGLNPVKTYHVVVKGIDKAGNEAISDDYSFTTASDTRPPEISNLSVEGESTTMSGSNSNSSSQLVVSWNTDEPATSQVEFGEGVNAYYTQKTSEDSNLTYNHLVVVSGLIPSQVYHLRAASKDAAGNLRNSPDNVTITPKATESAYDLVISNLGQIFSGFGN